MFVYFKCLTHILRYRPKKILLSSEWSGEQAQNITVFGYHDVVCMKSHGYHISHKVQYLYTLGCIHMKLKKFIWCHVRGRCLCNSYFSKQSEFAWNQQEISKYCSLWIMCYQWNFIHAFCIQQIFKAMHENYQQAKNITVFEYYGMRTWGSAVIIYFSFPLIYEMIFCVPLIDQLMGEINIFRFTWEVKWKFFISLVNQLMIFVLFCSNIFHFLWLLYKM